MQPKGVHQGARVLLDSKPIIVPFLKWAGGKRWLTSQYPTLFPESFNRYFEPFLGSGAVFFHLSPTKAVLADQNWELINLYSQIRSDWQRVAKALRRHHRSHSKAYYYEERQRKHFAEHEKAAQFLYLNRTCWNGLYRVNLRGEFNVPVGTKQSVILDTDDFECTAKRLTGAELLVSDFEPILSQAAEGDFAFIDPPYVTRHNFNGFVKYNDKIFAWKDQERLCKVVEAAASRGVKILLTNADHHSIRSLYSEIGKHKKLLRHSVLAGGSEFRGLTTELAIAINY